MRMGIEVTIAGFGVASFVCPRRRARRGVRRRPPRPRRGH